MAIISSYKIPGNPNTYEHRVKALQPVSYYPLSEVLAGDIIPDKKGGKDGSLVQHHAVQSDQPTIAELDSDGKCLGFDGANTRITIPFHSEHRTASGGICILVQPDHTDSKQIVAASDAQNAAGGWSLEILAGGQVRGFLRDAGNVLHELSSAVGAVTKGIAYHLALTWGAAGLKLYVDGSAVDTDGTITSGADLSAAGETTVSGWHNGVGKFKGLLGWFVVFSSQPSDDVVVDIGLPRNVTHANPDAAPDAVAGGPAVILDALDNDHYQGTKAAATVLIAHQGSLGAWAVNGNNDLTYTPGPTVGVDTAGRYRVNGSNEAALSIEVAAESSDTRDAFWASQGYQLFWASTPTAADVVANDPSAYFAGSWANGQTNLLHGVPVAVAGGPPGQVDVVNGPGGFPCIRCMQLPNTRGVLLVVGTQLGNVSPVEHAVFAIDIYNPSVNGFYTNDGTGAGDYMGFGHCWGSDDNIRHIPGGSTNWHDAWSIRLPKSASGNAYMYIYPSRPDDLAQSGISKVVAHNLSQYLDTWTRFELEVISNTPGVSNAVLRGYYDGTLVHNYDPFEVPLRGPSSTIRPKGIGSFVDWNVLNTTGQTKTLYLKNWRIYIPA